MKWITILLGLKKFAMLKYLTAFILFPSILQAQDNCHNRDKITSLLVEKYSENQSVILINSEAVFELWVNDTTRTWTVIMSLPSGVSCIMASGKSYEKFLPITFGSPT